MPVRDQYLAYILEQLHGLEAVRSNRMFGGIGIYSRDVFFGLIDDDTLFFKTDEMNVGPYEARRMPRFAPFPDRPEAVLGYHQVPADVIEDAEELVAWARGAVDAALRRKAARAAPRPRALKPKKRPPVRIRRSAKKSRQASDKNTIKKKLPTQRKRATKPAKRSARRRARR